MVLDKMRGKGGVLIDGVASRMRSVNPSVLTALSVVLALLFAVSFYYRYLIVSFFLLLGASYLDALDGAVARIFHKSSRRGDFFDHLVDRYVDFIILFALAVSFFGNLFFGLIAMGGTFLSSYVGTQAQAVGLKRIYGGFPGRADRLVIIMIGIIVQLFTGKIMNLYFISWILIFLGVLGFINSFYRAILAYRSI